MAKIFLWRRLYRNYDQFIKSSIKNSDLRKLLMWHTVFLGGTPKNVPALYILMLHVDMNLGTFYPEGGMFEVAKAFENLSLQLGVKFVYGKQVKKISVENFKVKGVEIEGELINADIVVCNADYHHVQTELLEKPFRDYDEFYWEKRVMSPGTFLCYLGIEKKLDQILHHNYFFTDDWDGHFDSISKKRSWPEKYSYYVSCRSKSDALNAPENSENIMLLVPLAPGLQDNDETREDFKEKLLQKFELDLGEKIRDKVSVVRISTHRDQIKRYNAYKGNSFGLANTLFQTGPLRPSNKSKKIQNLYYTGTGTIPGIGVPLTVISGQVTAEKIIKENAKQRTP
ncbi:phytoene desaturase [candidate division WOR-3 bacterium]|nr:phytoene desaturase [candidate division WOR-3 bacterium]